MSVGEFGALLDPDTGQLERAMLAGQWPVWPKIEARDGFLTCRFFGDSPSYVGEGKGLLADFLALANAPDSDVEKYARKWGILGLCCHGLPTGHESVRLFIAGAELAKVKTALMEPIIRAGKEQGASIIDAPCWSGNPSAGWREPTELWRFYADLARNLLRSANLARIAGRECPPARLAALNLLADELDRWLTLAPMQVRFIVDQGRPSIRLVPQNPISALSAVLAAQVCFAASGSKDLLLCANCGRPYFPKRKPPREGTRTYCPRCGKKAAQRSASAGHYARKRATLKLRDEGKSIVQIATRLDISENQVESYLLDKRSNDRGTQTQRG